MRSWAASRLRQSHFASCSSLDCLRWLRFFSMIQDDMLVCGISSGRTARWTLDIDLSWSSPCAQPSTNREMNFWKDDSSFSLLFSLVYNILLWIVPLWVNLTSRKHICAFRKLTRIARITMKALGESLPKSNFTFQDPRNHIFATLDMIPQWYNLRYYLMRWWKRMLMWCNASWILINYWICKLLGEAHCVFGDCMTKRIPAGSWKKVPFKQLQYQLMYGKSCSIQCV